GSQGTGSIEDPQGFAWSASDASGVTTQVQVTREGAGVPVYTDTADSGQVALNAFGPGTYTITVTATDLDQDRTDDQLTTTASRQVVVQAIPKSVINAEIYLFGVNQHLIAQASTSNAPLAALGAGVPADDRLETTIPLVNSLVHPVQIIAADVEGDGYEELLLLSPGHDGFVGGRVRRDIGRVDVVSFLTRQHPIPADVTPLSNLSLSGSGNYLTDDNNSGTQSFESVHTLSAGQDEMWFHFATLGDGLPGDSIVVDTNFTIGSDLPATLTNELSLALYTADGRLIDSGFSVADLSHANADSYYLRVYNASGAPPETEVRFSLSFLTPSRGQTRSSDAVIDRDHLMAGEGDDIVLGGRDLDRLEGGQGADALVGTHQETIDFDSSADRRISLRDANENQGDGKPVSVKPLSIAAHVPDRGLRLAIADTLGLPTEGIADQRDVITTLKTSDLARLVTLDAQDRGITTLGGLQWATNLRHLNLSGNPIEDLEPLRPLVLPGDHELPKAPVGTRQLRTLILDGAPNSLLASQSFAELSQLRYLSMNASSAGSDSRPIPVLPASLAYLSLENQGIDDLAGISRLVHLRSLNLAGNQIRST
ncbi:MAG: hypothetical protein ABGZ35_23660, partial [Planctomycetaceae bacterium]